MESKVEARGEYVMSKFITKRSERIEREREGERERERENKK